MRFFGNPVNPKEWQDRRREYYLNMAKSLGVSRQYVDYILHKDYTRPAGSRGIDIGMYIKIKAGTFKKTRNAPKKSITKISNNKMKKESQPYYRKKVRSEIIECTSRVSPSCLRKMVRIDESTTCIKCKLFTKQK